MFIGRSTDHDRFDLKPSRIMTFPLPNSYVISANDRDLLIANYKYSQLSAEEQTKRRRAYNDALISIAYGGRSSNLTLVEQISNAKKVGAAANIGEWQVHEDIEAHLRTRRLVAYDDSLTSLAFGQHRSEAEETLIERARVAGQLAKVPVYEIERNLSEALDKRCYGRFSSKT